MPDEPFLLTPKAAVDAYNSWVVGVAAEDMFGQAVDRVAGAQAVHIARWLAESDGTSRLVRLEKLLAWAKAQGGQDAH